MRARMFKPQFAPLVLAGVKRQTIRPTPRQSRLPKPGDFESWRQWSGLPYRTKQIELCQVELTEVLPITIDNDGVTLNGQRFERGSEHLKSIALQDGFMGIPAFMHWFIDNHGLPFCGILIRAKTRESK